MKKIIFLILIFISIKLPILAENRWNIYAGGSISHLCEKPWMGSDKSYGWGGGAFFGTGYEFNLNEHWNITPQLEFSYINNGATLSSSELDFYSNHSQWKNTWNVSIPILMGFRFPINDKLKFRIAAGPYIMESICGKYYGFGSSEKDKLSGNIGLRTNVGLMGEISLETGKHLAIMFRPQYPFLKEGWIRKTLTLAIGLHYYF